MATDVSGHETGTQFPELFQALADPFGQDEEKRRKGPKGETILYITARTVMNRLDKVLGPENWWDSYAPAENSVQCALTIRLPNGEALTKCDAGGYAGMADSGDDDKSGYSDSFKRAAVKFGVGRYLYRDGTAFEAPEHSEPQYRNGAPAPHRDYAIGPVPRSGRALFAALKDLETKHSVSLLRDLNEYGKQYRWPKLVDMSSAEIADAWHWIDNALKMEPPSDSPPPGYDRPDRRTAREMRHENPERAKLCQQLLNELRAIDRAVHNDPQRNDPASMRNELSSLAQIAQPGWKLFSLKELTDPEAFHALIRAAKVRRQEVEDSAGLF